VESGSDQFRCCHLSGELSFILPVLSYALPWEFLLTKAGRVASLGLSNLRGGIERAGRYHEQLVLIVGESASALLSEAAITDQLPTINVGVEISSMLLDVPRSERAKVAPDIFTNLIEQQKAETLLLDHIEVLFDRSLSIDPLKLLQACAKSTTLVVVWPGTMLSSSLVYATPNHPEYRSYKESVLNGLVIVRADESEKEKI